MKTTIEQLLEASILEVTLRHQVSDLEKQVRLLRLQLYAAQLRWEFDLDDQLPALCRRQAG